MSRPQATKWTAATASGNNGGDCVEVTIASGADASVPTKAGEPSLVLVRDSKDPEGSVLTFTFSEWEAFLDGVAKGEFTTDRLLATLSLAAN